MALSILTLKSREEIPDLLNELELTGTGVEIGVGRGWYSDVLLRGSRLGKLFSIDPWCPAEVGNWEFNGQAEYRMAVASLARHGARSEILKERSLEAVLRFADAELDFVYIDANHGYDSALADIRAWWPKVRPGGVFAGHDYCTFHLGVTKAVDEFFAEVGLAFHLTALDFQFKGHDIRSWLVQKP